MKAVNNKAVLNLTKHLILASKHKYGAKEEISEKPELLIRRTFPFYPVPRPAYIPIPLPEQKSAEEIKPEKPEEIFELGKITKFAMDKLIDLIECPGPNLPLKIRKEQYVFLTDMKLTEQEIKEIIEIFSKESKLPISQVFTASAKGLSITAIVASTGSRFVLKRARV